MPEAFRLCAILPGPTFAPWNIAVEVLASNIENFLSLPLGIRPNLSCAGIVPEILSLWGVTVLVINVLSSYYVCL